MRKLVLLIAAVAALNAIAIPAAASAAQLTSPAGTVVPLGTNVTLTSSNFTMEAPSGATLECATITVKANVTKNSGGEATANSGGVGTTEGCKIKGGPAIVFDDPTLLSLALKAPAASTASLTYQKTIAGATCHYLGTNVPVTYTAGTDVIKFANAPLVISGPVEPCGTPGPEKVNGSFTLTKTAGGAPVIVD